MNPVAQKFTGRCTPDENVSILNFQCATTATQGTCLYLFVPIGVGTAELAVILK
jgi:hypothetical protein